MLIGPPGSGKTLSVAKIAAKIAMEKTSVDTLAVITTDDKRAGGIEQLQAFTNILGIELEIASNRAELKHYLESLPPGMQVIIDTAGCNPFDAADVKELKGLATLDGVEPVLVLPAGGDSLESIDIVEAFSTMPIKRFLITRADTARRFGGILAAAAAHGLAFCHLGDSASITDALKPMNSALLAQLLLSYQDSYQLQSPST